MYTIQWFKEKFSAIKKWRTLQLGYNGEHCALGHCGVSIDDKSQYIITEEANALISILLKVFPRHIVIRNYIVVTKINDGIIDGLGATPKERIMKALEMAEELEQQEANLQFVQNEQEELLVV